MAMYSLTPIVVNLREARVQLIASSFSGATVYGKNQSPGRGKFVEVNLNDGVPVDSLNVDACMGRRRNPEINRFFNMAEEQFRRNIRGWENNEDPQLRANASLEADENRRKLRDMNEIRKEAMRLAAIYKVAEFVALPKAPPAVDFLVRKLLTCQAKGVDLFPEISQRFQVPKFNCVPDKFSSGWYVRDEHKVKQNVEWLVDLVQRAAERVAT